MSRTNIGRGAATLALAAAFLINGCTEKTAAVDQSKAAPTSTTPADPRATVIGVEAGGPANDTPQTTSSAKSDISKAQQSSAMPMAGQANDHSTLSPKPTQKAAPTGR